MVRTNPAIVRAPPADGRVVARYLLWSLDENFSCAFVIVNVISKEHTFCAMLVTAFQHPDAAILKHDLGVYPTKAGRTY
jgi:hypothetical protein